MLKAKIENVHAIGLYNPITLSDQVMDLDKYMTYHYLMACSL